MPLQQLMENVPDSVEANEWVAFVQYRRSAEGQALSQRNTRSRAAQRISHTAGSKMFAVTYSEMQEKAPEENRQTDYGELYTRTHRHRDGTLISEAAEEIIARIEQSQQEMRASQTPELQVSVDPTATLKAAVGLVEHPGRVRGFGLGARPSMVYDKVSSSGAGTSGLSRPPLEVVDAMIAEKVAAQVAEQLDEKVVEKITARTRHMQESLNSWFATQRHSWQSLVGALTELLADRRFPSPEPPPPFIFKDSHPAPPAPRPEHAAGENEDDVTSGRARAAP